MFLLARIRGCSAEMQYGRHASLQRWQHRTTGQVLFECGLAGSLEIIANLSERKKMGRRETDSSIRGDHIPSYLLSTSDSLSFGYIHSASLPNLHTESDIMSTVSLIFGFMLALVAASPLAEPDPVALSVPPLVPSVPGFTDPISQLAPPLPVLQAPTPALTSPPFQGSDIKPKKIGYFWTGAGDNNHAGMSSKDLLRFLVLIKSSFSRFFGSLQSG